MKKMKSVKQQITTALSLTLVVMAIAVCAPEQTFAQQRTRRGSTSTMDFPGGAKVKAPQAKVQGTSRREFDKGYLTPYASNSYTGTTMVNQGIHNNLTVNGGAGNDTLKSTNAQRRKTQSSFYGTGVYLRQNSANSSELTNSNRTPKSGLLATTYGRGSFHGMQGHPGNDFKSHTRPTTTPKSK